MVVFSHYPEDPRVRREAEALEEKGYIIDVFCLNRVNQKKKETYGNISVHRSSVPRTRSGKINYLLEYFSFLILMIFIVAAYFIIKKYKIIHVHNMPDILALIGAFPKLFGAKIILDLHDPTPEVYMSKYGINKDHKMIKFLISLEKLSINLADKVLTPNIAFKELFVSRGNIAEKIEIVMNSPNESIFPEKPIAHKHSKGSKFSIIYHGSIVERHGLYDALLSIKSLRNKIPELVLNIYGDGDYKEKLVQEINALNLNNIVFFHGFLRQEKLVDKILESDLGIIPNRRNPFTEVNLPTRIFEYLCMGKPVIVPETKGIKDYFTDDSLLFFESGNSRSLAEMIYKVYSDPKNYKTIISKGIQIYKKFTWRAQKKHFTKIVSNLIKK